MIKGHVEINNHYQFDLEFLLQTSSLTHCKVIRYEHFALFHWLSSQQGNRATTQSVHTLPATSHSNFLRSYRIQRVSVCFVWTLLRQYLIYEEASRDNVRNFSCPGAGSGLTPYYTLSNTAHLLYTGWWEKLWLLLRIIYILDIQRFTY